MKLIATFLFFFPRLRNIYLGLLITGGLSNDADGITAEVWLPSKQRCLMPSLPSPGRYWHTQSYLTACGGGSAMSSCHTFRGEWTGNWEQSHSLSLSVGRLEHVSWQSPAGTLLMGGFTSSTSTELLSNTSDTTTPGFDLPYRTS